MMKEGWVTEGWKKGDERKVVCRHLGSRRASGRTMGVLVTLMIRSDPAAAGRESLEITQKLLMSGLLSVKIFSAGIITSIIIIGENISKLIYSFESFARIWRALDNAFIITSCCHYYLFLMVACSSV